MKSLSKLALCLLLAMSLTVSAFAAQVPDSLVAENLNGQQRLVKTYTLSPEVDPDELKEENFSYDGYLYTWAYTTKVEHPYLESKSVTEPVTVNTAKNDLAQILAELSPSMPYEKDGFSGELALDHTTLSTEASGYTTKYGKTTETKVIGNLDRNDMSYVPATTIKNGKTLSLANVEWQVTGTALVGESLVPAQYQAVATYSASGSYQAATGYVTTAEYHGTVTAEGVDSITYTVVYTGSEIVPEKTYIWDNGSLSAPLLILTALLLCAGIPAAVLILLRRRRNVYVYGTGAMAAYGIGNKVNGLITLPSNGIGSAVATIVGQNIGANQLDRAEKGYKIARRVSVIFLFVGGLILSRPFLSEAIVGLFSTDEEVIAMAADFLSIMALWCFTNGIYNSTSGLFQGSGHTEVTMAVDATRLWVFRFATLYVCEHWLHMGVRSIWYSVVVSNALSSVILYVVYRTGLWKKKRV